MRILITGGAGFIGSHSVDRCVARGDTVLVVDELSTGREDNVVANAELVKLDVGSAQFIEVAKRFRPEAIVHFAAQTSVTASMANPVHDATANILAGINVCKAATAAGCGQLVYINTGGALYSHPSTQPYKEDDPVYPISCYGLSKWTLECYLRILLPPSMRLKVLRLANVYGPRQDPHGEAGVIAIFSERMSRGEPCNIYGDGGQTRDFVYVGDVAEAVEATLGADKPVTVNIATARGISVNDLFAKMAPIFGYQRPPVHSPERPGEMKHSVLANARALNEIGWSPRTLIDDGLRATAEWIFNRVK